MLTSRRGSCRVALAAGLLDDLENLAGSRRHVVVREPQWHESVRGALVVAPPVAIEILNARVQPTAINFDDDAVVGQIPVDSPATTVEPWERSLTNNDRPSREPRHDLVRQALQFALG